MRKILEKGSWSLLSEFMSSGKTDEDYYNAIKKYLGILSIFRFCLHLNLFFAKIGLYLPNNLFSSEFLCGA